MTEHTQPEQTEDQRHDNGHLVPVREWERIVQEAERGAAPKPERLGLGPSSFPIINAFVPARWGGGAQTPRFGVLHDAETPEANGYAGSIANYFSRTATQASAHFMLGPDAGYQLRDTNLIAWHCGNGNLNSIGVEQAGYAAFTRDQWLTDLGVAQLHRVATLMQEIKAVHGIGTYFMGDDELRTAFSTGHVGGWATHDQCRRILGGTTHTDPMPNYPFDVLEQILGGTPPPAPTPPPPPAATPARLAWILGPGQFVGAKTGPAASHGCDPRYDSPQVCALVQNVLQWFVYHDCVPGVPSAAWSTTTWTHGGWDAPYGDPAAIRWHARFYPGQPYPAQIWADDYDRLARP